MAPPDGLALGSLSKKEAEMVRLMRRGQAARAPAPPPAPRDGQWLCRHSDCLFAVKKRFMFSSKKECMGCFRPKNRAVNPPLSLRLPPAEPTERRQKATVKADTDARLEPTATTNKATARANAATGANSAAGANQATERVKPATSDPTPGPVQVAFDAFRAPARPKPVRLAGSTEEEKIGIHALEHFDVSTLYRGPPESPLPLTSADDLVAKMLPVASSQALADKEQAIAITKAILAQCPEWHPGHAQSADLLKTQEAECAKLRKQAPCPKVYTEQLKSARQGQLQLMTQWQEKNVMGKANADARLKEHLKLVDALSVALLERRSAIITAHTETAKAWDEFNQKRGAQWKAVLAQLDAKVANAELSAAAVQTPLMNAIGIADAARVPVPVDTALNQALVAAQQEAAEAKRKMEEFQRLCEQHVAATKAAEEAAARMAQDAEQGFQCTTADLPSMIPEPEAEQWECYHVLYMALEHLTTLEAVNGCPVPVTFAQLKCGLDVPRVLLGSTIWDKAFPGGQVNPESVITPRVRALMAASLRKHQLKLIQDKAKHDAAIQAALTDIEGVASAWQAKKRKASEVSAGDA